MLHHFLDLFFAVVVWHLVLALFYIVYGFILRAH